MAETKFVENFKRLKPFNPLKDASPGFKDSLFTITNKRILAGAFIQQNPIFYDRSKMWWIWKDFGWEIFDEVDLLNNIHEASDANTISNKERTELLEALRQEGRKNEPKPANKKWLQFKDTIYDLDSGKVFKATPDYFVTNPIPWEIGESDETPTMDRIFAEWVGEKYVKTLYQIIAYCLLPSYPLHRIFCFVGAGMNGKSKYLELIKKFIGDKNVTSTELDTLLDSRFEGTRLHKKLACFMGETNFNEMTKTSKLKQLSGGDLIGFEYKNKNPFHDYNYAKILISTNNLPTTTDKTIGFYRRWLIIDFPNSFNEKKNILGDIPEIEYKNLAKKCIQLLKDLFTEREFHLEGSVENRQQRFEERSNPFEKFWKEMVVEKYDGHIFKYEFRKELDNWLKNNRFRKISDRELAKYMKERGIEENKVYADWYTNDGEKPRYRAWLDIIWRSQ